DESDGYSSCSDKDKDSPKQQPNPSMPMQATQINPTHSPTTNGDTQPSPETSRRPKMTVRIRKVPDPKLSQIARDHERRKRAQRAAEKGAAAKQKQQQQAAKSKDQKSARQTQLKLILKKLNRLGLTMGDLVCYFFNPENQCDRWGGFWKNTAYFGEFMACITTRKNATKTGRDQAYRWAIDYVKRAAHGEAQQITASRVLQSRHLPIDEDFVFQFQFDELQRQLTDLCPVMMEVSESFATSTVQQRQMNKSGQAKAAAVKLKKLKASLGNSLGQKRHSPINMSGHNHHPTVAPTRAQSIQ
ncbi:hypothetical protein FRC10_007945, partial [Ceratobasidium sp. 414]